MTTFMLLLVGALLSHAAALAAQCPPKPSVSTTPIEDPLYLLFGAACIPHPEKLAKGGEDAYFADAHAGTFGVADGVGGSAVDGVDPGVFSRRLLQLCHSNLCVSKDCQSVLRDSIRSAADAFTAQEVPTGGHSTLLLGQLSPTGMLRLLNVGDSAVMIFRPSPRRLYGYPKPVRWPRIVARSHEAQHYFNCPYQVSAATLLKAVMEGADEMQVAVCAGDVVVAVTDGVIDNMFQSHIQELVAGHLQELAAEDPADCASRLNALARQLAEAAAAIGLRGSDPSTCTPFAEAARAEGIVNLDGGKLDDCTVVCGVVKRKAASQEESSLDLPTLNNFIEQ